MVINHLVDPPSRTLGVSSRMAVFGATFQDEFLGGAPTIDMSDPKKYFNNLSLGKAMKKGPHPGLGWVKKRGWLYYPIIYVGIIS